MYLFFNMRIVYIIEIQKKYKFMFIYLLVSYRFVLTNLRTVYRFRLFNTLFLILLSKQPYYFNTSFVLNEFTL